MRVAPIRSLRKWLVIATALAVALSTLSTPAAVADSAGTTVYAPGADGSYLAYNRTIRLAHSDSANGTLLSTFEHGAATGQPGSLIIRSSADDGITWNDRAVVHDGETGGTHPWANFWQPYLYEFPTTIGAFPAGTLLLVLNVVPKAPGYEATHFQSFRSTDHGATWTFVGVPQIGGTLGKGIWEPFIGLDSAGAMNMYFSDERQSATKSQFLAHIVSTDGGVSWSANPDGTTRVAPGMVRDVSSIWQTDRPGMVTIAHLPNNRFIMSYELCGGPDRGCNVYTKTSSDGNTWGAGPSDLGTQATTTDGRFLQSTPTITWSPAGGPNGTVLLTGRYPSGPGASILTNTNLGLGTWSWSPAPFTPRGTPNSTCSPSYSPDQLPSINGRYLRVTTPSVAADGTCTEQTDTQNIGFLPYNSDFATGRDRGWLNYGGCWSIEGDVYSDTCGGAGGNKSFAGNTGWTDYTMQSDVKLGSQTADGNAGMVVRTSNPTVGTDNLTGYFVGVSPTAITLGRQQNNWTALATAAIPNGLATGSWYHLSTEISGCTIRVQGNPVGSTAAPVSFTYTDTGCSITSGAVALRDFKTNASWRNVTVTAGAAPSAGGTGVYQAPFASGNNPSWATFGGTWSVAATTETLSNSTGGSGDKQLYTPSATNSDYTAQSDVQLASAGTTGNAGLLVRASDAAVGADALTGYYAGFTSTGLVLGRENNGWTALASTAFATTPQAWYHLTVTANGCTITATLNAVANATDNVQVSATDCSFPSGAFGVRTFGTTAKWKNLTSSPLPSASGAGRWVSSSQKPMAYAADLTATNFTCRFPAQVTAAGGALRVRLSNLFVSTPTTFGEVTIAARGSNGALVAGSTHPLTVNGVGNITIAANSEVTSDPITMTVARGDQYYVSLYVVGPITKFTNHYAALATGYCSGSNGGNHAEDATAVGMTAAVQNVGWVSGIEVLAAASAKTIVAIGDSITDGTASTPDTNRRWTDVLASRLATTTTSVTNAGIAGNTLVTPLDQNGFAWAGPLAVDRFDRDVLQQAGVSHVIIFEGSNDICFKGSATSIIGAIQQLADRAHTAGVKAVGGTIIGRGGDGTGCNNIITDAQFVSVRNQVNNWIRTTAALDGVVDFDAATKNTDPTYRPGDTSHSTTYGDYDQYIAQAYDSGDHVHPSDAGYAKMGQAVDLSMF